MKTHTTIIIIIIIFNFLLLFSATAQDLPLHRPVSKQVQYVSNKRWIYTERLLIVGSVGYLTETISKDVALISNKIVKQPSPANMISAGYPELAISKGVHKIARQVRSGKKPQPK